MPRREDILQQLIDMSHWLGDSGRGLAALGEGNSSAKINDNSFFVKATGSRMGTMSSENVVEMDLSQVLDILSYTELSESDVSLRLADARVGKDCNIMPSIETLFHAYLLSLPGVNFVGHTHPISVNGILCAENWKKLTKNRIFPYEVVYCGVAPAHVEYADPGVSLAHKVRESVEAYIGDYGTVPKAILMQNHGIIATGSTADEVLSVTEMWDKTARILTTTMLFGGPHFLSEKQIKHLGF